MTGCDDAPDIQVIDGGDDSDRRRKATRSAWHSDAGRKDSMAVCTIVKSILGNNKYKCDALCLKTFTADYFTKPPAYH